MSLIFTIFHRGDGGILCSYSPPVVCRLAFHDDDEVDDKQVDEDDVFTG